MDQAEQMLKILFWLYFVVHHSHYSMIFRMFERKLSMSSSDSTNAIGNSIVGFVESITLQTLVWGS